MPEPATGLFTPGSDSSLRGGCSTWGTLHSGPCFWSVNFWRLQARCSFPPAQPFGQRQMAFEWSAGRDTSSRPPPASEAGPRLRASSACPARLLSVARRTCVASSLRPGVRHVVSCTPFGVWSSSSRAALLVPFRLASPPACPFAPHYWSASDSLRGRRGSKSKR